MSKNTRIRIKENDIFETYHPETNFDQVLNDSGQSLTHVLEGGVPKQSVLSRGAQFLEVAKNTPVNALKFSGKTVINYIPLFNSGLWKADSMNVTTNSPNKITGVTTSVFGSYHIDIPIEEGVPVTLSAKLDHPRSFMAVYFHNSTDVRLHLEDGIGLSEVGKVSRSMVTPFGTKYIRLVLSGQTIDTFTFENVMLNKGMVAHEFVSNVKGIKNPTIEVKGKNLVPPISQWVKSGLFINESVDQTSVSVKINTLYATRGTNVVTEPNKTYTFSVEGETSDFVTTGAGFYYNITEYLNDGSFIVHETPPYHNTNGPAVLTKTFTTSPNTKYVRVLVGGHNFTGKIVIKNAILVKGGELPTFERHRIGSFTALGTFHEGDEVYVKNNRTMVTRKRKEVILDNDLPWVLGINNSNFDYKVIGLGNVLPKPLPGTDNLVAVKYDGTILPHMPDFIYDRKDVFGFDGSLAIAVSNKDSGWGPDYTPTYAEVRAFINGWRMRTTGTNALYNGVGDKFWATIASNGIELGTASLPTTVAPETDKDIFKWQPYRLLYVLAEPKTEQLKTIGSLNLEKGINTVELTEGRIVRERANISVVAATGNAVINSTYTNTGTVENENASRLKNKAETILKVYRNGKPDILGEIRTDEYSYGKQRYYMLQSGFNPTSVYEVDYIPSEPYDVSASISTVSISYDDALGGITEELVNDLSDLKSRFNSNESFMEAVASIAGRGAVVESGSNANGEYTKFSDGTLICRMAHVESGLLANINAQLSIVFPSKYSSPPVSVANVVSFTGTHAFSINALFCTLAGWTTTVEVFLNVNVTQGYTVSVISIGRWK